MTVASQKVARNEVMALFKAAWDANLTSAPIPILWDGINPLEPPQPASTAAAEARPWVRIEMRHNVGGQAGFGDGVRRYRRVGIITVEVFTPMGTGFDALHDELVQIVKDAFEGKTTPSDVEFRDVSPKEVGPTGPWFQSDVNIAFEYDEIK